MDGSTKYSTTPGITGRRLELISLIHRGLENKEIAHAMRLSVNTVGAMVTDVRGILDCESRVDIALWYERNHVKKRASMHHIRPWRLFSLVPEKDPASRLVMMKIPLRRVESQDDHSLRLLDMMCIIAAIRIVQAKKIFEIGTFRGNTTLHMALNSDENSEIYTLDADEETIASMGMTKMYEWRNHFPPEYDGCQVDHKIHQMTGNSQKFDFNPYVGQIDLMLIDADHSYLGVMSDTNNALEVVKSTGCIAWHDYLNPTTSGNTFYLDELSDEIDLFHIEDTTTVLHFRDQRVADILKGVSSAGQSST